MSKNSNSFHNLGQSNAKKGNYKNYHDLGIELGSFFLGGNTFRKVTNENARYAKGRDNHIKQKKRG